MPKVFNYKNEQMKYQNVELHEYNRLTSENLSKESNVNKFDCKIRILEKWNYSYPYHYHHNAEEVFVILEWAWELRTSEGIQDISKGDIILFEIWKSGAHQLFNNQIAPLIYVDIKTNHDLDVCEYPDTEKVILLPSKEIFYKGKKTNYFEGEINISRVWEDLRKKDI